jgi:phosphatidylglycerophosphatase A
MLSIRPLPSTIHGNEFFYNIVTWFQSGRIRPGSGTWGSLAALPACWIIKTMTGTLGIALFAVAILALGMICIKHYASHTKHLDPAEVVIDEVLGMAALWVFTPLHSTMMVIIGFILFRIFDAVKRGPVGWCDKNIKGPAGVMIDDLVAGLFAGLCVWGLSSVLLP